jgi:GNAT superfamily N-acetyltransferase
VVQAVGPTFYSDEVVREWANRDLETLAGQISACISNKDMLAIIAKFDGEITGYGLANLATCYLGAIYISPSWMREGIGTSILLRLEDEAKRRGLNHFQLNASLNSESFYKRNGYQIINRNSHMLPSGIVMACVKMSKPLIRKSCGPSRP